MYSNWYSCLHFPDTTTLSLIAVTYSRVFHPCYLVPRFPLPRFQSPRSTVELRISDQRSSLRTVQLKRRSYKVFALRTCVINVWNSVQLILLILLILPLPNEQLHSSDFTPIYCVVMIRFSRQILYLYIFVFAGLLSASRP